MRFKLEKSPLTLREEFRAMADGIPTGLVYALAVNGALDLAHRVGEAINTRLGINYADDVLAVSCVSLMAYYVPTVFKSLRKKNPWGIEERAQPL